LERIEVCLSVVSLMPNGEKGQKEDLVEGAENAGGIGVCLSVVLLVPKGKKGHGEDLAERQTCFRRPRSH